MKLTEHTHAPQRRDHLKCSLNFPLRHPKAIMSNFARKIFLNYVFVRVP